ncbi:hypothetical protein [Mycobacterium sp. CnD-18-1]|uniref:hypothetical protein n=1 Tax=Mycobacterium sp. CnD-18-1 TaxID=2917744 RepID=UPI001EF1CFE7|nr:hypothetical protein [Mycobacterium sp. CnD-18-1]MCG7607172.1 hypothetical protein [Mycobacterium sp. CnD-18-1]
MDREPWELRLYRKRKALRDRQYRRGGFWPRVNFYRSAPLNSGEPRRLHVGLDRTYGPPISLYVELPHHALVLLWRFAPRPQHLT